MRLAARLQRRIVPELRYSQDYYEGALRASVAGIESWLDLGCGHQILPPGRLEAEKELVANVPLLVGIDYDLPSLLKCETISKLVRGDIGALPFADGSFDLVTANMVVEHLSRPREQFAEIARILRPGGKFLFHTPNSRGYPTMIASLLPDGFKKWLAYVLEGRGEEDVFRTYYRANSEKEIEAIAQASGLNVEATSFTLSIPVFWRVPPLAFFELFYIRALSRAPRLAPFRQTLICVLQKPPLE